MSTSSKSKKLATDTILFGISTFGSRILVFLLTPLYTAVLLTQEYGVADLINTTVNLIYPVLTLAIADATLRYALDKGCSKRAVLNNSIAITCLSLLFLLALYPLIRRLNTEMTVQLSSYWGYFAAIYGAYNFHLCFSNFVKGIGKTKLYAVQGIVQTLTVILCNIYFLLIAKIGLRGYLLSVIIGHVVPTVLMFVAGGLVKYIVPFELDRKLLGDMLKYSIPMIPTILSWAINTSIDKYMIIWLYGMGASGVYSVAHKIPTIITTILNVFIQAWQISVISNYGSEDQSRFYTKVYKGLDLVSISGCMFVIFICRDISRLLFANEFFAAWQYVPMLVLAAMFSSHAGFLAAAYRAAKKTKSLFVSVFMGALVNICLNLVLLRKIGVLGAAVATAASFFTVWLVRIIRIQKIIRVEVELLPTAVAYVLLFLSATLVTLDIPYARLVLAASYLLICVIRRETLRTLITGMLGLLRRGGKKRPPQQA